MMLIGAALVAASGGWFLWKRGAHPGPGAANPTALLQPAPVVIDQGALSKGQASALSLGEWASRATAAPAGIRPQLLEEGLKLAEERREWMRELIETNPEEAIRNALSYTERMALPPEVRARVEQPVSGVGTLAVVGIVPEPDAEPGQPGLFRTAFVNDQEYDAFVYGRRLGMATLENAPLHGIAVGRALAVHESPVRVVPEDEAAVLRAAGKGIAEKCPVSSLPVEPADAEAVVQIGNTARFLCSGGHVQELESGAIAAEGDGGFTVAAASVTNAWSQGPKTLLYIRIRFLDQTNEPQTFDSLSNMMVSVNNFFRENSYHSTDITTTITPTFVLPYDTAYYTSNGIYTLRTHALNAAKTNGYDYVNWNLDAVRYAGGPGSFGGAAYVGSRGCWMKSSSAGVAAHEFGHNYGLWHANSWNPTDESPIGPGTWSEYGDSFDTMGAASAGNNHFNARYKAAINWIPPEGYQVISNSGLYQVYAHDNTNSTDLIRGLRVVRSTTSNYSIEFRQKFTTSAWHMNGAGLRRTATANNNNPGSELIDTTPLSPDGKNDSALIIGRTFSDPGAGIHITPLRKMGTSPESLEVDVRYGTFPGNTAPTLALAASSTAVPAGTPVTLTATATDADGDSLSYYWDLGDKTYGANAASVTKSWSAAGDYLVQCEASDRKGRKTLRWIVITVGTPTTFRISGRVLAANGSPVQGVRVHNGRTTTSYRGCYTDADGYYSVVGLAAGSYTMVAGAYTLTVTNGNFTNPVTVSPSRTGIDFLATPRTYVVSGRVTEGGFPVGGVLVGDGTRSALTDTNGYFSVAGFENGSYTLTATKAGGTYNPSGWSNPVAVQDGPATNRNFAAPTYTISGEILGVPLTNVVIVTDGYRSVNSSRTGSGTSAKNTFTLTGVPAGRWNLRAFYPGASFSPSGFSNPLVLSANTSARNFAADAVTTYSASGTISENGAGVPNVTVSDGTRSSTTDTRGGFYLQGLANGTYTVTPQLAGYSFSPAAASLTINGTNSSGLNFTASRVVYPTVTVTASASPVPEAGGAAAAGLFTITRSGLPATNDLTVNFTLGGTASAGADYEAVPGSVTLPSGQASVQVAIVPVNDTAVECPETVQLVLSPAAGSYDLGSPASATLNFDDDDLSAVTLAVTDAAAAEAGLNPGQFRVTRTGCLTAALTVAYTIGGDATPGADYAALPGTVTIPAGASSATVTVTPVDDAEPENTESISVTLVVGTGYTVESTQQGAVAIADNDTNLAPVPNAGPDQTVSVLGLATLSGSATDDGLPAGGSLSLSWSKVSGPGTVLFDDPAAGQASACFSAPGAYTLRLTASDGPLSASDDVLVTVTEADPARVANALNAGGTAFVNGAGLKYGPDGWATGGSPVTDATATVTSTQDGTLYQSARQGAAFSLDVPLPGGAQTYLVALKFAELTATAAGQRLLDVSVNGQATLQSFDIFAAAGGAGAAVDVVFPVSATGDTLSLAFSAAAGSTLPASVCAVVVGSSGPVAIPAPGTLTAASATGATVDLAWVDRSSGETGFSLERSSNGGAFAVLATLPADTAAYTDATVATGVPYAYRVRALAVNGSAYGNVASLTTPGAPPAPGGLAATAVSSSQINLAWTDNAVTEGSFTVERSTDNVNFTTVATLAANTTSYAATGLAGGTTYYFRVRACGTGGCSGPASASATTLSTTPAAPTGLTATSQTGLRIVLAWTDNSGNETGFSIERSTRATSGFKAITSVGANVTTFSDTLGLSSDKVYYYRIRATNSAGASAYSNTASATARR